MKICMMTNTYLPHVGGVARSVSTFAHEFIRQGHEALVVAPKFDVFAFASVSETQGMVVAEAMAAGLPVVALNAPGVREVVRDGENGILLPAAAPASDFSAALGRLVADAALRARLGAGARETAGLFSRERCAARVIAFYGETRRATRARRLLLHLHPWTAMLNRVGLEWDLLASRTQTVAAAMLNDEKVKAS
ncbi:MAG: glycosyltransferase [Opitutaceae bacterium]|nr:glycosyltransferase [Opitutaceae bacterium]